MNWMNLLYIVLLVVVAWFAFRTMKNNPALFSKENMGKSFFAMGILALILIAFIALLVFLLKQ
jgi:hypothetical protein